MLKFSLLFFLFSLSVAPVFSDSGRGAAPTFARDVAPILFNNCASCHRPGEVAPFSLLRYEDAKKRARLIAEVTQSRLMPPWKPQKGYGEFAGERHLSAAQIELLRRWAAAGAPEGDASDLPPQPKFTQGWQMGKPDMIITMPKAITIPADGPDVSLSFVIPVNLPRDKYIRATEFRPGNRRVVHHASVFTDTSGKARQLEKQSGGYGFRGGMGVGKNDFVPSGSLGGYVPGMMVNPAAPDAPSVLPKNSDVVFGLHYHPSGKAESDQSSIGLYFTDKAPRRIGSVILMGVLNLEIQPGESAHPEKDTFTLPVDVEMQSIAPHMHIIGKTVRMWAELPNGTTRPLIKINDWDFNWQGTFYYQKPFRLPRGTKIHGEWTHDNSKNNPRNPTHPPRRVTNGENSTDEMAAAWIPVLVDRPEDNAALWVANLGHLAVASMTPPVIAAPYALRRLQAEPHPSIGLSSLRLIAKGVAAFFLGLIQAPGQTWPLLLTVLAALFLLAARLFPAASSRAAEQLKTPWRCLLMGLLSLMIFVCIALPMLFATPLVAQIFGALGTVIVFVLTILGLVGMTRGARENFRRRDAKFARSLALKSGAAIALIVCFAGRGAGILAALIFIFALGAGASVFCENLKKRFCALRYASRNRTKSAALGTVQSAVQDAKKNAALNNRNKSPIGEN